MHVLVVTTGSDRSERAIYLALAARGHRVTLLGAPGSPEADALRAGGVDVRAIRIRNRLDLLAAVRVRGQVRALQPDVIYAPRNDSLAVCLFARRGRRPAIVAYRGTIGHISRCDPASWITYLNPGVAAIVCVSEAVRAYLLTFGLAPARAVTIHKGHDVAWYDALAKPTRASLGLPEEAFLVGFTGRIRPVKGGDYLLQAVASLPPDCNVHLVIVGEIVDEPVKRLMEMPALRGRVHVLGFRKDAAAIAAVFDAFAMPSVEREGLPRAVIEAMAQRVTPLVTRVGGMPELVEDGVCGRVVPPRDAPAIAEALAHLARDLPACRRLGAAARRRIETHFNVRDTADRMEQVFRQAAGNP